MLYSLVIRPFLFLYSPEKAHSLALKLLRFQIKLLKITGLINIFYPDSENTSISFCGIEFKNGIGLAAGFDKDAKYIDILQYLGFGFIEVGTVTPKPQIGNPQPRLFRLAKDKAIINRMGFNNEGVDVMVSRLKNFKNNRNVIIGGNIGKNKDTPNEDALSDYLICFEKLFDYVDYFVVNVSSPNTPNLRALQNKEPLQKLLEGVSNANSAKPNPKPILLKIAPDLSEGQLDDIIEIFNDVKIDGLILNNTTIDRSNLLTSQEEVSSMGNGGLSGAPLFSKSLKLQQLLKEKSKGSIPYIGVGGIMGSKEGIAFLKSGASMLQIYTGFIYMGPSIVKDLKKLLTERV